MNTNNANENDMERFSDDPEEQLRIENEILKLKLRAELGGRMEQYEELSPEFENLFLSHVLEFEQKHAKAKSQTIYDLLGKPDFIRESLLSDDDITKELGRIEQLLLENSMVVEYATFYPDRHKYKFITEEFFLHRSSFPKVAGMTMYFSYEEFHPDHESYIRAVATAFTGAWFKRDVDAYDNIIAREIITPEAKLFASEQVIAKIRNVFNAYLQFQNERYLFSDIQFELDDQTSMGLGFAEGEVIYDAMLESGEVIAVKGPFKLYFQLKGNVEWQIFFFYWPGFEW